MENLDFGHNYFAWRLNFRFDLWNEQDLRNMIIALLPDSKPLGISFIEDNTDEKEGASTYSVQISDKKESSDESAKLIRVFSKGLLSGAGPGIPYEEWIKIRSSLCLSVIRRGDVKDLGLVKAIDAQFYINIPSDKISQNIFSSLVAKSSPLLSHCPLEKPTLLDFHFMVRDGLYRMYLSIDTEKQIDKSPYTMFNLSFPLMELPTAGSLEETIKDHFEKVDSWGPNVAQSIIVPLLES